MIRIETKQSEEILDRVYKLKEDNFFYVGLSDSTRSIYITRYITDYDVIKIRISDHTPSLRNCDCTHNFYFNEFSEKEILNILN